MIKQEDVTIIIPHLGESREQEYSLETCLQSLRESAPAIKVIVARNGRKQCMHPWDVHVSEQGQCKAVNAAAATTNTPWIMVSNDDMVYPPGWWDALSWSVESHGKYEKCISPQLVEPIQGSPTFITYPCGGAGGDFDKDKFFQYSSQNHSKDLRNGFNLPFLISRNLWDTVGGYDINYDPWGSNSDSDLEYKIRLAGVLPMQTTECLVYHFSQTSGTFHPDNHDHWQMNWEYFKEKWGFYRTDEGIWEANFYMPMATEGRIFTPEWEGKYGPVYN